MGQSEVRNYMNEMSLTPAHLGPCWFLEMFRPVLLGQKGSSQYAI